jgi:hypothetical protein
MAPRCVIVASLSLPALLLACSQRSVAPPQSNTTTPAVSNAAANKESAERMAPFAGMIGSDWETTSTSGYTMFDRWSWGPGHNSVRVMTDGESAGGTPWRNVQIYYWHPQLKQICLRGFSCYAGGISEGSMTFDGTRADGRFDLFQDGGRHRTMGLRWEFDGADAYKDTLLESTNSAQMEVLASWTRLRVDPAAKSGADDLSDPLPPNLAAFSPLLDHSWETFQSPRDDDTPRHRTTFEWVPLARVLHVSLESRTRAASTTLLVDAYLHEHAATRTVRCLALTADGGVYEGAVTKLTGTILMLRLSGTDGTSTREIEAEFELTKDETIHSQVRSVVGGTRLLEFEAHQVRHRSAQE